MATMLNPTPAVAPGRISQLLPTVKCSNCSQLVPLADLGDHTCPPPPSMPTISKSPTSQSTSSPSNQLQSRLAQSVNSMNSAPSRSVPSLLRPQVPQPPPQRQSQQKYGLPTGGPKLNISASGPFAHRSGPLARADPNAAPPAPANSRPGDLYAPRSASNLRDLQQQQQQNAQFRARTASNSGPAGPSQPPPQTSRPSFSSIRDGPPMNSFNPQGPGQMPARFNTPSPAPRDRPPRQMSPFVPPTENDIDTKSGGAAGMAGVGRRGFAAAARAAMFVGVPGNSISGVPPQIRRAAAPGFLDLDAVSRTTVTPPLSAGSGYSSHSPGPVSPLPQTEFPPSTILTKILRTPSPPNRVRSTDPTQFSAPNKGLANEQQTDAQVSLAASVRLPFLEKHKLPGTHIDTPTPSNEKSNSTSPKASVGNSVNRPVRSTSVSTIASRQDTRRIVRSPSPESEGGLAYADGSDSEDISEKHTSLKTKANPPPPLSLISPNPQPKSPTHHIHSKSTSDRSDHVDERKDIKAGAPSGMYRKNSSSSQVSSNSSAGDDGGKVARSNSSKIAHALGLSQTPPSAYSKLGGPGVGGGGRVGRSASGSSSSSSNASRSIYSRDTRQGFVSGITGGTSASGALELAMETLLEEVTSQSTSDTDRTDRRSGLSKRQTIRSQRSFGMVGINELIKADPENMSSDEDRIIDLGSPSRTRRSKTVQGLQSPETRPPKLPTRSKTSPITEHRLLDSSINTRRRKPKVCIRCSHMIDDGRWVQVDSGGVLCEKCWKNMYLPKCRRCNLPIEKQAVSSSDGQLKGKYHKECFNCHTCHKPFPDKTFYVYDGKPLCAYHYHEANDSLCAAARCGQPIEGPCAVSHTGDRYHPEHMTCEHPGYPACDETLKEYWEVDGRMLCERHAHAARAGSDDEDEEWVQSSRAMKRVTRFIDLTGMGAGVGAGGSELV